MTMLVRLGGAWQTITGAKVFASGSWRTLSGIKVYASGAWRDVASFSPPPPPPGGGGGGGGSMTLSISPDFQSVTGPGGTVTSNPVTATPSGGVAPYTYTWSISDLEGNPSINSPTLATTTFSASGLFPDEPVVPSFQCVCRDSLGNTASAECSVSFTRT